jgi:hypothetical protein
MQWQFAIYLILAMVAILVIVLYFRLANSPAFRQKSNEVVTREPGKRFLGPSQPVVPEARKDLEFAWLSHNSIVLIPKPADRWAGLFAALD